MMPHVFNRKSRSGYVYCGKCFLVALSNDATRRAINKGCSEAELIEREEKKRAEKRMKK